MITENVNQINARLSGRARYLEENELMIDVRINTIEGKRGALLYQAVEDGMLSSDKQEVLDHIDKLRQPEIILAQAKRIAELEAKLARYDAIRKHILGHKPYTMGVSADMVGYYEGQDSVYESMKDMLEESDDE